ncbi:hypothetical protein ADN00_18925 [Ornatilinea apprima]|uniref:Uncharacterized protein n=1 Tax=Ornatilinea apprima TaxID=1134406 RepID=A0A0P6WK91_9CHLR|nr:hypothetical protein [Ornatilinea apprima]KPL70116.1 hypothetical protein ADN00_18925 [Ornatilinea apprima]
MSTFLNREQAQKQNEHILEEQISALSAENAVLHEMLGNYAAKVAKLEFEILLLHSREEGIDGGNQPD